MIPMLVSADTVAAATEISSIDNANFLIMIQSPLWVEWIILDSNDSFAQNAHENDHKSLCKNGKLYNYLIIFK